MSSAVLRPLAAFSHLEVRFVPHSRWALYAYEAAGLGGFVLFVGVVDSVMFAPQSPVSAAVTSDVLRRAVVGLGAGLYLVSLVYSPWGRASGAQINPSITLAFLRLGKMEGRDASFYILAQFAGAIVGAGLYALLMGSWASTPSVNYIVTVPGPWGWPAAFVAEVAITLSMFLLVLRATRSERFRPYTGLLCGCWLALLVLFESPISGTSLNPARTLGPNLVSGEWNHMLLYFIAPPLGAQIAATMALRDKSREAPCAKLHHDPRGHPRSRACVMKGCAYRDAEPAESTDTYGRS